MKIKLYFGNEKAIKKSGIGRAFEHQKEALELNNIEYSIKQSDDDYDILHINTVFPDSLFAIRRARKNNKKIIFHAHSTKEDFQNSFKFSNILSEPYGKWLIKLYSSADAIITPTPYSKSLLESYNINLPIYDISNGIDTKQYNPTEIQKKQFCSKYNIKENDKIIISVGWLFERKGFDTFVEVAKELPQYKFIWFGDIKLSNPTEKISYLVKHLPDNVFLPGYESGDIIKGAYGRANLFFFPSREETEGIVVLEALACKTPVLLRDIPVFDSWLVDKRDCYKGLSNNEFISLIKSIVEGDLPSTIDNGYKVAKERELDKIGLKLKEVYEKTLNR